MTPPDDALLGMLSPLWGFVIGVVLVVVVVVATVRLVRRGPSRMSTALLVTGAAIVGVATIGVLLQSL